MLTIWKIAWEMDRQVALTLSYAWQRHSHNGHFDFVNRERGMPKSRASRATRRKRSSERHTITRFYDAASSTCNWKSIPERFRQSRRAYVKNFIIPRSETNTYAENAEETMERNMGRKKPGVRRQEGGWKVDVGRVYPVCPVPAGVEFSGSTAVNWEQCLLKTTR